MICGGVTVFFILVCFVILLIVILTWKTEIEPVTKIEGKTKKLVRTPLSANHFNLNEFVFYKGKELAEIIEIDALGNYRIRKVKNREILTVKSSSLRRVFQPIP